MGRADFARMLDDALDEPFDGSAALPSSIDAGHAAFERTLADFHILSFQPAPKMRAAEGLGVEMPCSVRDIVRAFRRLAFKTHPDRPGGSHEAFLRAQALFHEALASLQAQAEAPASARLSRFRAPPPTSRCYSVYA